MATPVVLTTGARPIVPVESGGVPMTPVDTLGEPVTVVDALGEPVVLINEDGTPAFLAYSAKTYLGGVAPYHWLDFINNRALYAGADVGNVTQATGYTFTRASQGYYQNADGTLTNFASGALRRGDRGVLIEGSRTNLVTRSSFQIVTGSAGSQYPDGTGWSNLFQTGGTRTFVPSAIISGAQAMDISGVSSARSVIGWTFAAASSTTYVVSFYIESVSGVTGTVAYASGTLGSGGTTNLISAPTTTGRVSYTFTTGTGAGNVDVRFGIGAAGNESGSIRISNVQIEAASFPSSYIPTVAASATRAADSLSISDARSAPFTMFAEFEPAGTAEQIDIIAYDTLTNGSGIYLSPTPAAWVRESGVTTALATGGSAAVVGSVSRVAARFAVNDTLLCNAGTLGSADTSNSPPSTTVLKFSPSIFGGVQSVYLRRVAIIASGATNAQLQAMTT